MVHATTTTGLPQIKGADRFTTENIATQGFNILPEEVQRKIFENLGIPDRAAAALVCKQWKAVIGNVDDTLPYFLNQSDLKRPTPQNIPTQKHLPPETLEHVLSFLGQSDKRSAAKVSSHWNAIINPNPLRPLPFEIFEHILSFLDPKDFQEASRANLYWRKAVIPYVIRRRIAEASAIPDEKRRSFDLQRISSALTQLGNIGKAIEVANSIDNKYNRGNALERIGTLLIKIYVFKTYIQHPDIEDALINIAIETATSIPSKTKRSTSLQLISTALIQDCNDINDVNVDTAIKVANLIPVKFERDFQLQSNECTLMAKMGFKQRTYLDGFLDEFEHLFHNWPSARNRLKSLTQHLES